MNEPVVDVIGAESAEHPVDLFFDDGRIGRPSIFAFFVVGAEMDLVEHFVAHGRKSGGKITESLGVGGCQIGVVDAVCVGILKGFNRLLFGGFRQIRGTDSDDADLIARSPIGPILHLDFSFRA